MSPPAFLRGLVELATCETVDALLDHAVALVERELGVRASIELFDRDDLDLSRGIAPSEAARTAPYRTWIGTRYTVGAIYLGDAPADVESIELLACQLAPLAERLVEREASERRTIREDIARLYERRIRDALLRHDWNASAVARELGVSRGRVAEVARRWRTRNEKRHGTYAPTEITAIAIRSAHQNAAAARFGVTDGPTIAR